MPAPERRRGRFVSGAVALAAALLLAGCAAADKNASPPASSGSSGGSTSGGSSSMGNMPGMSMGSNNGVAVSTKGVTVNGIKPVPSQVLATTSWQGMKITARTMTPAPFVVYNGTKETLVKPTSKTSFHLMVMLDDEHTGVPIPYAGVWATILQGGKVIYDERQWPMLSAFMGPHYGNNVALPGAGTYQLRLLISPPVSARHIEYQHVWLKPHKVTVSFHWTPPR
jgi:Fe2+ transport protein